MHGGKKTRIKPKEVGCPPTVLQSKPVQILPFCTRNCLLPLKVLLHFQAKRKDKVNHHKLCYLSFIRRNKGLLFNTGYQLMTASITF